MLTRKKTPILVAGLATLALLCPVPAAAEGCRPQVNASLVDRSTDEGAGLETLRFEVEVSQEGADCGAVDYVLVLHERNTAGEVNVVRRHEHVKVDDEAVTMRLEHQMSTDNVLDSWEVADTTCHPCGAGD